MEFLTAFSVSLIAERFDHSEVSIEIILLSTQPSVEFIKIPEIASRFLKVCKIGLTNWCVKNYLDTEAFQVNNE